MFGGKQQVFVSDICDVEGVCLFFLTGGRFSLGFEGVETWRCGIHALCALDGLCGTSEWYGVGAILDGSCVGDGTCGFDVQAMVRLGCHCVGL